MEVLVASAVGLVLLAVVAAAVASAGWTSDRVAVEAALLEDTRAAADLITDEVARAIFVYPPGTTLRLNAGVSAFTRNPVGPRLGSNTWLVGRDPVLAFVQAPRLPGSRVTCDPARDEGGASRYACAEFVAYYAVRRGEVVAATRTAGGTERSSSPGRDPENEGGWLLYEYRRTLPLRTLARAPWSPAPLGPPALGGATPDLVADHVLPGGFEVTFETCAGVRDEDAGSCAATTPSTVGDGNPNVTALTGRVTLRAGTRRAGRTRALAPITVTFAPPTLDVLTPAPAGE